MRCALICHQGDALGEVGLARWLGSFSSVVLIVRLVEPRSRVLKRLQREVGRSGAARLLDIAAFKLVHALKHRAEVHLWETATIQELCNRFPPVDTAAIIECETVNDPRVRAALLEHEVDFALARCKQIIGKKTFSVPPRGVFVLHPGICPEYRNAHGCFWAMAEGDFGNVGTTLLKIDEGVDTGPIYAYLRSTVKPPVNESPMVIQQRTLFDNLDAARVAMQGALDGTLSPINTAGRKSAVWGQPWYTAWRRFAR